MAFITLHFAGMNPSHSYQLQMQALREALERSARATFLAEEHTVRALSDLQAERLRAREMEKEISRLTQRHATLLSENRRLRNLVGEACQDRNLLSTELKTMLRAFQEPFGAEDAEDAEDAVGAVGAVGEGGEEPPMEPPMEQRRDAA